MTIAAPTVVFDLDGTLVDTAPDIVDALNVVFGHEGLPPFDQGTGKTLIGGGARRLVERGLALAGRHLPDAEVERICAAFVACYADHLTDRSRPFPGADAALTDLSARGYRLAICTNKLERLSVRLLATFGLADRFAAICGEDTFSAQKPDAEALLGTLRLAGGQPDRAVMVGDLATDILTARAAGVAVVAVDFGYGQGELRTLMPETIISSFNELRPTIETILKIGATSLSGAPAADDKH